MGSMAQLAGIIAVFVLLAWTILRTGRAGDQRRQRWADYFARPLAAVVLAPRTATAVDLPARPGGGCGLWLDAPSRLRLPLRLRLLRNGHVEHHLALSMFGNGEDDGDSPLGGVRTWPWTEGPSRCVALLCLRAADDTHDTVMAEITWEAPDAAAPAECRLLVTALPYPE